MNIRDKISAALGRSGKTVAEDLQRAEQYLETVYKSAEVKSEVNTRVKYSFGGPHAKTSDTSLFEKAQTLEKDGADSETIRKETGWFIGYDGKWRFEIDDSNAQFDKNAFGEFSEEKLEYIQLLANDGFNARARQLYDNEANAIVHLGDIYHNEELYNAYPDLKNIRVNFEKMSNSTQGAYDSDYESITLNYSLDNNTLKSVVAHEIQHAIQDIEGFTSGTDLIDAGSVEKYQKTAGEIEARDVESRMEMTAEQRKNTRPDIDRADVVFADSVVSYNISFNPINKESINNARLRGDKVLENKNEILSAIGSSLSSNIQDNYIIGSIPTATMSKITNDLKENVFKNGEYVFKISSDDIRHLRKHFSSNQEILKAIYRLYDTVCNFDTVEMERNGSGLTKLVFNKSYFDYDYLSVEIASKKKRAFDLTTFYVTKNNQKKKGKIQSRVESNDSTTPGVSPSNNIISKNDIESQEKSSKGIPVPTLRYNTEEFAKSLIRKAQSTIDVEDVTEQLKEIVKAYNKFDTDRANNLISKLTLRIAEYQKPVREWYAQEYLDNLKGETIRVYKEDLGDIYYAGDTLKGLKDSTGIKFVISESEAREIIESFRPSGAILQIDFFVFMC